MCVSVARPAAPSPGSAVTSSPSRHTSSEDSAVLSALMMAGTQEPGLGEGYDWVECGSCRRRLASSVLRRGRRVTTRRQQTCKGARMTPVERPPDPRPVATCLRFSLPKRRSASHRKVLLQTELDLSLYLW
jgi:hypothetical protein